MDTAPARLRRHRQVKLRVDQVQNGAYIINRMSPYRLRFHPSPSFGRPRAKSGLLLLCLVSIMNGQDVPPAPGSQTAPPRSTATHQSAISYPKRVFVVDRVIQLRDHYEPDVSFFGPPKHGNSQGEYHTAPAIIAEFNLRCPGTTFTASAEPGGWMLISQLKGSTMLGPGGDVLYKSSAKTASKMVKDMCKYFQTYER